MAISDVQKNRHNLLVNDVVYYSDDANCEKFTVTDVDTHGFEIYSEETGEYNYKIFHELQQGWDISEKSKANNSLNFRTIYI